MTTKKKIMNVFEETIRTFLDGKADADPEFASRYAKEGKSVEKCCDFIISEVRKTGRRGFADEEIFGLAVHYYDEDNVETTKQKCTVVVNREIQLTEAEKARIEAEARKQVEDSYREDAVSKILEEQKREKKRKEEQERRRKEAEESGTLFLFND